MKSRAISRVSWTIPPDRSVLHKESFVSAGTLPSPCPGKVHMTSFPSLNVTNLSTRQKYAEEIYGFLLLRVGLEWRNEAPGVKARPHEPSPL